MDELDVQLREANADLRARVLHLETAIEGIHRDYVRLERYVRVESAVFGLLALIVSALVAFAMTRLLGHP